MATSAHRLLIRSSAWAVCLVCCPFVAAQSSNPCAALAAFSTWNGQVSGATTGRLSENDGHHTVSDNQQGTFKYNFTTRASDVDPLGDPFTFGGDTSGNVTINNSEIYYFVYPPGAKSVQTAQFAGNVSYPLGNQIDNATLSFAPNADGKSCTYLFHFPALVQGVLYQYDSDNTGEHKSFLAEADWLDDVYTSDGKIDADTYFLPGYLIIGKVAPDATGINRTATYSTQLGGVPRSVTLSWSLQSSCQQPTTNANSAAAIDTPGPTCTPNIDVSAAAFIEPESVDGPGILYAPLVNAFASVSQKFFLGLAGAAAGITCDAPPLYGNAVRPLTFSGNDRSFDPNATSYKIKETFSLNTSEAEYPDGKAADPIITTTDTRSYAPNSFAGGRLIAAAKSAMVLSKPRCDLLFNKAAPNTSLVPLADISRGFNNISAHIEVQVGDPLIVNSNAIDGVLPNLLDYISPILADLTLNIDTLKNTFTLSGSHSCFPAFELYLNKIPIYTFSPSSYSLAEVTRCLAFRSNPITVEASGGVPFP